MRFYEVFFSKKLIKDVPQVRLFLQREAVTVGLDMLGCLHKFICTL